ncbi:hypothetical protein [Rhodospirillaceae bacterium SYSU D60014]|uniref:hypothetical protein n=1 Tax=Virgifigura deserti TaxID=2268457 RepID=UPI000E664B52
MAKDGGVQTETEAIVTLAGRYEILPTHPIPELASPGAPAFAVRDSREPTRRLFALLYPKHLPLREEPLSALRRLNRPQPLPPVDWGVIDWPGDNGSDGGSDGGPKKGRWPAVIFEAPGGNRLMPSLSAELPPMSEDTVTQTVLRPVLAGLKDMALVGLSHGAIRPDNLFFRSGSAGEVVLGESCSAPPGFHQPVLFLTIEGGMASPGGRGGGSFTEDLYALGVTLAILLIGRNPMAALDDDAVIAAKIAQGSFAAIAGQMRLSMTMTEALRGLLADNTDIRWTFDQLDAWLDGRRLSPNPPNLPPRAGRPFRFDGNDYWTRPSLAHAMARRWDRAIGVVEAGEVEAWLRRSHGDEAQATRLAVGTSRLDGGDGKKAAGHLQLAWALMALDPGAPMRYRGFAARIDSMGTALAASFDQSGAAQTFVELIQGKLPQAWMEMQGETRLDFMPVRKIVDMLRYFLDRPGAGFSIERCLYELNPGLPCRSPLLEEEYVSKVAELLPALNRVAARGDHEREPIDRHIAAFIAARMKNSADRELDWLRPNIDVAQRRLAILRLLAVAEETAGGGDFSALRAWLAAQTQPIIDSYQYRPFQKSLRRKVAEVAESGWIADLVRLLDSHELRKRDSDGFARARIHYAAAQREVARIEAGEEATQDQVSRLAHRAAAAVSGITAGFVMLGVAAFLTL